MNNKFNVGLTKFYTSLSFFVYKSNQMKIVMIGDEMVGENSLWLAYTNKFHG